MTQIYANNFGSYPTIAQSCSLMGTEWNNENVFDSDNLGIIDCDQVGLYEELKIFEQAPRSLSDDIKLIESNLPDFSSDNDTSVVDDSLPSLFQPELRNYNCMWSGTCSPVDSSICSTSPFDHFVSAAVPPAAIMCKNEVTIKTEPIDDIDIQHKVSTVRPIGIKLQGMHKIPPGTSLLINSRKISQQPQQIHKKSKSIHIPVITTAELLRDRQSPPVFGKPDTPPSLNDHHQDDDNNDDDDEATEFKHTYDLTACITGSNNISLLDANGTDKDAAINRLREQLEDTNKNIVPPFRGSLADVLSIIDKESIPNDDDDDDGISCIKEEQESNHISLDEYDSSDEESSLSKNSDLHFMHSNPMSDRSDYPMVKHSDHSYTRCKGGIDDISPTLDTPSDSDEEIDVVSLGDKKLPTNPSDKDRRALQSKVAHKFSTARIVKTSNGIRTIPPRRRVSYDLPYTPASVSPVKSGSSPVNSRYPSPTSTPYSSSSQYSSASSTSSTSSLYSKYHHLSSRKRMVGSSNVIHIANGDDLMPPGKRYRGKKQKASTTNMTLKRHYSIDEIDTIEKRNLHNDMERQRRIGLKNLFEALKKQIPSIKDKERAPKVNILREAAKLCESLTREEQLLSNQKEMLREQMKKRQELLNHLRAKHNANREC